jgi:hypothetical protein
VFRRSAARGECANPLVARRNHSSDALQFPLKRVIETFALIGETTKCPNLLGCQTSEANLFQTRKSTALSFVPCTKSFRILVSRDALFDSQAICIKLSRATAPAVG